MVPADTTDVSVIEHVILALEELRGTWIADESCIWKQVKLRAQWIMCQLVTECQTGGRVYALYRPSKGG